MNLNVFDIHKKKMDVKRTYLFLLLFMIIKFKLIKRMKKKHTHTHNLLFLIMMMKQKTKKVLLFRRLNKQYNEANNLILK